MYTKFDFEKFKQSRIRKTQTLDGLDALDEVNMDFAKTDYEADINKNLELEERDAIIEYDC